MAHFARLARWNARLNLNIFQIVTEPVRVIATIRKESILSDENEEIADWLERLTTNKRNWGFGLCFLYLRNVQGYGWILLPGSACLHA